MSWTSPREALPTYCDDCDRAYNPTAGECPRCTEPAPAAHDPRSFEFRDALLAVARGDTDARALLLGLVGRIAAAGTDHPWPAPLDEAFGEISAASSSAVRAGYPIAGDAREKIRRAFMAEKRAA